MENYVIEDKSVTEDILFENYEYIRENLVVEKETGKEYRCVILDYPPGMIQLIEPNRFKENIKKIAKEIKKNSQKFENNK